MKFTGVSMKIPAEEIGVTATFQYTVNAVDRTKVFDAKLVVETYANMYAKEIFSRIVYRFTAVDAFLVLADLNDGGSGTAVASGV